MNQASRLASPLSRAIPAGEPWHVTRQRMVVKLLQAGGRLDMQEAPDAKVLEYLAHEVQEVLRVLFVIRMQGVMAAKTQLFQQSREGRA
ncbi:hypothetical protein [Geothrix sp. 21YS21S-2]|uniref:hypothetical protein n=1 Tax=Geothrix sp. 21YS21S-2 TaxID=3068893 RepID=UPI0027BADF01|nr:hypothetical protein [Geothrix sp. 21YS21S-2]